MVTRSLMLSTVGFLMKVRGSYLSFEAVDLQKISGFQRAVAYLEFMNRSGVSHFSVPKPESPTPSFPKLNK